MKGVVLCRSQVALKVNFYYYLSRVAWGSSMVVIKGSTDLIPPGMLPALRFYDCKCHIFLFIASSLSLHRDKDYIKAVFFIGVCPAHTFTQTIELCLRCLEEPLPPIRITAYFVPFIGWIVPREKPKIPHR